MVNHPSQLDEALEVARVYPHAAADPDAGQLAPLDEQVHLVPAYARSDSHLGDRQQFHGFFLRPRGPANFSSKLPGQGYRCRPCPRYVPLRYVPLRGYH